MKTIKVSVCISVHNTAHLLPRCLDSLLKQTMKDLEIVLVNNGSSDNSEDIMRQYSNHYPQIQWQIIVQEDRGLAQGRQTGINHAIGEYIAFLDADDYVDSHMYGKLYDVAIENSADIENVRFSEMVAFCHHHIQAFMMRILYLEIIFYIIHYILCFG